MSGGKWQKLVVFFLLNLQGFLIFLHHQTQPVARSMDLTSKRFQLGVQNISDYFVTRGNISCFIDGIASSSTSESEGLPKPTSPSNVFIDVNFSTCKCLPTYTGADCGTPKIIAPALKKLNITLRRRSAPRRLVSALPINHEFLLLEARMAMHAKVVDVFLVQESNFTNSGEGRPLEMLKKLEGGWLEEHLEKLVYLLRTEMPAGGFEDGKEADADMRRELSRRGLGRLDHLQPDDLFLYTDSDELPRPEVLLFLKLYDGLPHLVSFAYIWAVFGFFWRVDPRVHGHAKGFEKSVMTIKFFSEFYANDASKIRTDEYKAKRRLIANYEEEGHQVGPLEINQAGWHCSWCFKPEGIRKKLLDAPRSDFPRYGDYPGKTSPNYIARLIKHGRYFDRSRLRNDSGVNEADYPDFAPPFMLQHRKQFLHLLENPYRKD